MDAGHTVAMTVMTSDLVSVSQDHHESELEQITQEGKTTGDAT